MVNMFTAIIQARKGSTRYPNKMLMAKIDDSLILDHIIFRLLASSAIKKIILAVPEGEEEFGQFVEKWGIDIHYGSEDNVLERFVTAAEQYYLKPDDWILRICGDAPFPHALFINHLSYIIKREDKNNFYEAIFCNAYPKGQQTQAYKLRCLKKALSLANEIKDEVTQEHIDPLLDYRDAEGKRVFKILEVEPPNLSVDTEEDERRLNEIVK